VTKFADLKETVGLLTDVKRVFEQSQFRPLRGKSMPGKRRAGQLPPKKTRSVEVAVPDRWNGKTLQTTYQRAYCRQPYDKTRPTGQSALGRSADFGGEDPITAARKKLWQTTYEDAYLGQFPTSILSLSGPPSVQPEPPDVAVAVTTQSTIKSRSLSSTSTLAQCAGMTLSRRSSGKKTTGDPRWKAADS
jgi:hypothetical protein